MIKERKTKAQRAFAMLQEASAQLELVSAFELQRLAKAVNPELNGYELTFRIFDFHWWIDQDVADGMMDTLCSSGSSYYFRMRTRLSFFRAERSNDLSSKQRSEVVLVAEFKFQDMTFWINAETGMFWDPLSRAARRRHLSPERRDALMKIEQEAAKRLFVEREHIWKEKTEYFGWYDHGVDYDREARHERLELLRRPNPKAEWKVIKVYAERFHPAGSALDYAKAAQTEFLQRYEAKRQAQMAGGQYPEHQPNHSEIQEVQA